MASAIHATLHSLCPLSSAMAGKPVAFEATCIALQPGVLCGAFASNGASMRRSGQLLEDSCFRVCQVRSREKFLPATQFVENSWNTCRYNVWNSGFDQTQKNAVLSGRHVCGATTGQGSSDKPVPEEDDPEARPEHAPSPDGNQEQPAESSQGSGGLGELDWRAFRARLVQSEQAGVGTTNLEGSPPPAEKRWAHPILEPEAGCVLIATEKLDGQQNFERTVILLLSPGSSTNPREGPYGLILNRPISRRVKDIKPKDRSLVKHFGNCLESRCLGEFMDPSLAASSQRTAELVKQLNILGGDEFPEKCWQLVTAMHGGLAHLGGPLDAEVFLLLHGTSGLQSFQEVIPGVYYGAADGLESAGQFAKERSQSFFQGFRFFFGYSGWGYDQLKQEIKAGLWCVAACSPDLITSASASGLWEEVLQLMGGKYAELSKRPRRKHF